MYRIIDSWWAPQGKPEVTYFEEWYEVEEYIDNTPELFDRIMEGYARIEDVEG